MQAHTHASSQPFQCSSVETFAAAPVAYELALLCQSTMHLTSSREARARLYLGQTGKCRPDGLPGHTDGNSAAFACHGSDQVGLYASSSGPASGNSNSAFEG